jgi:hypothetical protein
MVASKSKSTVTYNVASTVKYGPYPENYAIAMQKAVQKQEKSASISKIKKVGSKYSFTATVNQVATYPAGVQASQVKAHLRKAHPGVEFVVTMSGKKVMSHKKKSKGFYF